MNSEGERWSMNESEQFKRKKDREKEKVSERELKLTSELPDE